MTTRTLAVVSAGLSVPSSTRLLADTPPFAPPTSRVRPSPAANHAPRAHGLERRPAAW